ncbi:hypothetical protein YTPLAS18_16100 [Nitrospira sp.]|nr:hypothetical protein YTPLAS18_16100 [Nitrospira sp.]
MEVHKDKSFSDAQNLLLRAVSVALNGKPSLDGGAQCVRLDRGRWLYEPGMKHDRVYFPGSASLSMVAMTRDGATLELGVVGCEGFTGLSSVLGKGLDPLGCWVQQEGTAWQFGGDVFARDASLGDSAAIRAYLAFRLSELQQLALCQQFHSATQRLCRWLLTVSDQIKARQIPTTQEGISCMIGVSRPVISNLVETLESMHLARHERGCITLLEQSGLERMSCECYRLIRCARSEYLAELTLSAGIEDLSGYPF